jgi:hypothetical protein
VQRAPAGEAEITLDLQTQQRIALQVAPLTTTNLNRLLKGYGRVLDPAPLAALTTELASAQVAATASVQEFERLKILNAQDNASTRALQAAEAAARRDHLLVQAARDKIVLSWGQAVAGDSELPALVRSLSALESLIVRIDLPAGESLASLPRAARLMSLLAEDKPLEGKFLDHVPVVDSQTQGQGFLFLVMTNALRLAPGAALVAFLQAPGGPLTGAIVPRSAVIRHNGKTWVYVQTARDKFIRREILLDYPLAQGWFVTSGLAGTDRIVVSGAQTLLSEELDSAGLLSGARD